MSRSLPLSFVVADAHQFARTLGKALRERPEPPSHVELLNLLARAQGLRNWQALQAAHAPLPDAPLATEDAPLPLPLSDTARKALMQFDSRGRLLRWPTKFSVQVLVMWLLWQHFESQRVYSEREVNEQLNRLHVFGDPATLRRELINHKLMERTPDCREYRKRTPRPPDEVRALLRAWRLQRRAASSPEAQAPSP
ncbi:DUF2087 domain-containing protein [Inhella gelatinilytica]|uniref:DUF2087 domain-containing protein n=1 Tax=Inhella gelatinilytica TaxID=2795030 RepID=A0A931IXY2_9BURK|nr:DUF2087 domain-containing protein [Inhella gelatinilytica]MBH9551881.1 DUF2087 domain-containing protein [Inhella gelatinilytica]